MDINIMSFVDVEEMDSVFDIMAGTCTPESLYIFFLSHEAEVVYFVEAGNIKGVISIGDLQRFYENSERELSINNTFFFVQCRNFCNKVNDFFNEHPTVNEVPSISIEGKLQGIIRYAKDEKIRQEQRRGLKNAHKLNWYQGEIMRFIKCCRAKVFLCSMDTKRVDENLTAHGCKIRNERRKRKAENGDRGLTEKEWKEFWGKDWYLGIDDEFKKEFSNLEIENVSGGYEFKDFNGKIFNFHDGARKTSAQSCGHADLERKIYMFGPCIVVGGYCKDDQTIASHLQKILGKEGYTGWNVLNKGLCGPADCLNRAFMEPLSKDDIVIIIMEKWWLPANYYMENGIDFTSVFIRDDICQHIVDDYFHCNGKVNEKIAVTIFESLKRTGIFNCLQTRETAVPMQDHYISWDINHYFYEYFIEHKLYADYKKIAGATVMNCNPFTLGHRHIIECALEYVDRLYVFVVEEDKSYFSFRDRLEMVKMGVEDLKDVIVIPSGKYILSYDTFRQYFEKEQVKNVESMDYDLYIFAEVLAPRLNINYRFVGDEPFDLVTKEYNNTMKKILPRFGIEVIEFPRKKISKSKKIISATEVRNFIAEKKYDELEAFVPESTIRYLDANRFL